MGFATTPILTAITNKMEWLSRRTELLAQNVANANTPDYRARDLRDSRFAEILANQASAAVPRTTNAKHLTGPTGADGGFRVEEVADRGATNLNGNTVALEDQLVRLGANQADYQLSLNLYRKHMDMLRQAIGRAAG